MELDELTNLCNPTFNSNSLIINTLTLDMLFQDLNFCISVFHPSLVDGKWQILGKYRSHTNAVTDIAFISTLQNPRLFSVAKDKKLVEYSISVCR